MGITGEGALPNQSARRTFYVFYQVDDDEVPTALRLEEYGGEVVNEYSS